MNPLFNMFNKPQQTPQNSSPADILTQKFGNMQNMKNNYEQFKQNFSGDPEQIGRNMINSGQISQEQANQIASLVNTFFKFFH